MHRSRELTKDLLDLDAISYNLGQNLSLGSARRRHDKEETCGPVLRPGWTV